MDFTSIPAIGPSIERYWAPVLAEINRYLADNPFFAEGRVDGPLLAALALLLAWLLIRIRRRHRHEDLEAAMVSDEPFSMGDEDAETAESGLSDEEIEAELAADAGFEWVEEEIGEEPAPEAPPARAEAIAPMPEAIREKPVAPPPLPEPVPAPVEVPEAPPPPKLSLFARLKLGLAKTSAGFVGRVDQILSGRKAIDDELYLDLEEALITADLGVKTASSLLEKTQETVKERGITDPAKIHDVLKEAVLDIMKAESIPLDVAAGKPFVIMVVGVNGVGKTTTIGKLAARYTNEGKAVLVAAGDTFRAAAIEQLEIWAERVGCDIIKQAAGADPSAVAFDAVQAGVARGADVVIVDTAGRLHTKSNLMEELKKTKRVMARIVPSAPHETVLVLDATTGQNAINQAKTFNEAIELSGIILTKLDGTSKGGCIVGICDTLHVPIRFIGIGEKIDDLRPFDAREFVDAMFAGGASAG